MGDDYQHGAVDEFGRVFSGDGSVHDGLFVADGSLIPSALGVNPFLTISALSERIAERKIRDMQGDAYPKPNVAVSMAGLRSAGRHRLERAVLERLFRRSATLPIEKLVNKGGPPQPDIADPHHSQRRLLEGLLPQEAHPERPLLGDLHGLQEDVSKSATASMSASPATPTAASPRTTPSKR